MPPRKSRFITKPAFIFRTRVIPRQYLKIQSRLRKRPKVWLVTGCAGFIGSHLVEKLLKLRQTVIGLDNFSTGNARNLTIVKNLVGARGWRRFFLIRGDIARMDVCHKAFGPRSPAGATDKKVYGSSRALCPKKVDVVLHQAGLGSVPRSILDPLITHQNNVTGTLNLLIAAQKAGVKKFVYASSSSIYGDSLALPKQESRIGEALSPYAVSKYADELYAKVFGRCYGMRTVGLRYFNVFGPRQNPSGAYAAVIPRWIGEILQDKRNIIYGDGRSSRDFCFVDNVVQANLLAGIGGGPNSWNRVFNVACGEKTNLRELHKKLCSVFCHVRPDLILRRPQRKLFRSGDVQHSLADISKIRGLLGYRPSHDISSGLWQTVAWYVNEQP